MSRFIIMSKFNCLVVGLLVGSSLTALSQPSFAQSSFGAGESRDPFSSASQGDSTGLLRLLNGIQNGKQTSEKDFLSQKQTQLSGSAEDFRAQQRLRFQKKQQQQPQQLKK
jgi:hypothetical protein